MTPASGRTQRWGADERQREHELLAEFTALTDESPRRAQLRDELVTMHLPLVRHVARRYRDRGESMDDLVQVGTIGLIKAVDRFDPSHGTELSTFATPTILGEIKRHFRDKAWAVKVPRRMQELSIQASIQAEQMYNSLQRAPTVQELADALGVTQEDVLDAIETRHAYAPSSLDAESDNDGESSRTVADAMGIIDPAIEDLENREALRPLLEALPERERTIILMRFFGNCSQTQIATELGISQMHVSRLLARTLATLRTQLSAD